MTEAATAIRCGGRGRAPSVRSRVYDQLTTDVSVINGNGVADN